MLAGCSPPESRDSAGELIRIGVPTIPPAIGNPYQGLTVPSTLALQAVFDTMTGVDERGDPVPALAMAWYQEDERTWIFELRPGVRFSNGEPLTAWAVVTSVEHMTSPRGRSETIGSALYQIERAEEIDELRVRVVLSEPDVLFPLRASVWRIPAPAHWRSLDLPGEARHAIGSGPFYVAERGDGRLLLRANPNAWRQAAAPALEVLMIPDATARLQALLSGAIDIGMTLPVEARRGVEAASGRVVTRLIPQVDYIGFVTERRADTPLADPRVRRALNLATDRRQITESILERTTEPASQLSFEEAFGYSPELLPFPHDPAAARALLAEAGYPQGFRLSMMVTVGDAANDTLFYQQIGADLRQVGVIVEIRGRPSSRQIQDLFSGTIQEDLFSWNSRGLDPLNDYRHRSCLLRTPQRQPFHCDDQLTSLLEQAISETDLDEKKRLYRLIAAYERENPPGILLWRRPDFDAISAEVTGYEPFGDALNLERLRRVSR